MRILTSIPILLLCLACEAPYWTDGTVPDIQPKPVVIAVVSPDSIPKVFLDMTRSLDSPNSLLPNVRTLLESATVGLMHVTRPIPMSLFDGYADPSEYGDPIWAGIGTQIPMFVANDASERFESGRISIQVDVPGHGTVRGSTQMPTSVPVQQLYVNMLDTYVGMEVITQIVNNQPIVVDTLLFYRGKLSVRITDPANEANYYGITLLNKASNRFFAAGSFAVNLPVDPVFRFFSLDRGNSRSEEFQYSGFLVFSDATFNGTVKTLDIDVAVQFSASTPAGNIVQSFPQQILIQAISKEYYEYIRSSVAQRNSVETPFSEPVPVLSNLSNGVGVLGAYRTLHRWHRE